MTDPRQSRDEAVSAAMDQEAVFRSSDTLGTDSVGRVEAHGIDVIPVEERHGVAFDLFSFGSAPTSSSPTCCSAGSSSS